MPKRFSWLLLTAVSAVGLWLGWKLFWFQTDDAYIAFRYVQNSILGHGYVWNAPPFLPVEGYTSFSWVVILDVVWRVLGVLPPDSANWISLACSAGGLVVSVAILWRILLANTTHRERFFSTAFVLVYCLSNRTFLAWTSSGLETALFNLLLWSWLYSMAGTSSRWAAVWATLLCLTRPDGMLFVLATACLIALRPGTDRGSLWRRWSPLLPFAVAAGHLAWRRRFYGEWLPNSYYAKVVAAWPESGIRYAASFALEYAVWLWAVVVLVWLWRRVSRAGWRQLPGLAPAIALATVAAHLAYYTLVVGGDHFEYRVYSYTIPLLAISLLWMLRQLGASYRTATAVLMAFLLAGYPLPWIHWSRSHRINERIVHQRIAVADALPAGLQWYGRAFDRLQFWLIGHAVSTRHQEHKVFATTLLEMCPTRAEGLGVGIEGHAVLVSAAVGVWSWVLPRVNVIDVRGVNDYVIARTPMERERFSPGVARDSKVPYRLMAHERRPPDGYIKSFRPNVLVAEGGQYRVIRRNLPLREAEIRRIESEWRERISDTLRRRNSPRD